MFVTKAKYNRLKSKCLDQTRELIEVKRERDELREMATVTLELDYEVMLQRLRDRRNTRGT